MASESFLIKDVRIFDGVNVLHTSGNVLVTNGLISAVTSTTPSSLPASTTIISGSGKTLIPGLIDSHIHASGDTEDLKQALRFGVTTVLDMHCEPDIYARMKKASETEDDFPDFKSACYVAMVDNGWPTPIVSRHDHDAAAKIAGWPKLNTVKDAENFVNDNIALGASYIKLMNESGASMGFELPTASSEVQRAVVEAAHRNGLLAVAHATCVKDTLIVLEAGVDGLMHTIYDAPPTPELVSAFKKTNAFLSPTLVIISSGMGQNERAKQFAQDPRASVLLNKQSKQNMQLSLNFRSQTANLQYAFDTVRTLKEAGIDILCGSDSSPIGLGTAMGLSTHHEFTLYVEQAGFTPIEALRSATSTIARRFKLDDRGYIKVGKRADLVLVDGDPTEDISCTLNLVHVWKRGKLLNCEYHRSSNRR